MKVPLPNLISQHRRNVVSQGYVSPVEKAIFTAAAATFSNRVTYGALTAAAAPAMKLMTGKTNLDTMSSKKFRSWFAEHKKQEEEQKRAETAQALTDACRNNANREEN